MKRLHSFSAALVLSLTGCTASGPIYEEVDVSASENGLLYVYRERGFAGSGSCYEIFLDDELMGCLRHGGYLWREVAPGKHAVEVRFSKREVISLVQQAKAGESYYVEYVVKLGSTDEEEGGEHLSMGVSANSSEKMFGTALIPREKAHALKSISGLRESI